MDLLSGENTLIILKALFGFLLLLAIIYTLGVVWLTEKKLDISYKLFLAAIALIFLIEMMETFVFFQDMSFSVIRAILKILFASFFLAGILTMRNLIRNL